MMSLGVSDWMTICGIISSIGSFFVILSYLFSRKIRQRRYNRVILYISICDLCSSIVLSFGEVEDKSTLCVIQGIVTNIFPLSAIFWSTVILFMIINFLNKDNTFKTTGGSDEYLSPLMYGICFGIPVILTFLPLATNRYGCLGEEKCWCYIANRSDSPEWSSEFWYIAAFYFWVWSTLILYLFMVIYIYCKYQYHEEVAAKNFKFVIFKLLGYPLVIAIAWLLPTVYDIIAQFDPDNQFIYRKAFDILSSAMPTLQGAFLALVFFVTRLKSFTNIFHNTKQSNLFSIKDIAPSQISNAEQVPVDYYKVPPKKQHYLSFRVISVKVAASNDQPEGNSQEKKHNGDEDSRSRSHTFHTNPGNAGSATAATATSGNVVMMISNQSKDKEELRDLEGNVQIMHDEESL